MRKIAFTLIWISWQGDRVVAWITEKLIGEDAVSDIMMSLYDKTVAQEDRKDG